MFEDERIPTLKVPTALIAVAALIASATAIAFPGIYKPIVPDDQLPFNFGQDVVSLAAAVLLLVLGRWEGVKINIVRTGLVGYLFYAYAQYVMGTLYNYLYFLYLAVFGLSIFYFINAFAAIAYERLRFGMPAFLRIVLALYCAAIAVYFAPQWVVALLHNIRTQSWPGKTGFDLIYYVYILDSCFVLPVCVVAAFLLLRKKPLGFLLGGILPIMGFTLMLSVAAGFLSQPLFGQSLDTANTVEFAVISFVFLLLAVFYFVQTKVQRVLPAT